MKETDNESRVICHMEKNNGERLVLQDKTYRGFRFLDLRVNFKDKAGEFLPTKKGLSLSIEQWSAVIPALQAALLEMEGSAI